jgi:hypothetical protein
MCRISEPLTGAPHTVPEYVTFRFAASGTAVPFRE